MKVKYDANSKILILDNEGFMMIPLNKNLTCIDINRTMNEFFDNTNTRICCTNFIVDSSPTIKNKLKLIWYILTMKKGK